MQENLLIGFIVIWVALVVGSVMIFQRGKDVAKKRKLWPIYTVFSNVVIGGFIIYMQPPTVWLVAILVLLVPLTLLTIRSTKFCDSCGQASRSPFFMKPPQKCSHCNKPLS